MDHSTSNCSRGSEVVPKCRKCVNFKKVKAYISIIVGILVIEKIMFPRTIKA